MENEAGVSHFLYNTTSVPFFLRDEEVVAGMISLGYKAASKMTGWVKISLCSSRKHAKAVIEDQEEPIGKKPSHTNISEIFFDATHAKAHRKLCYQKDKYYA